MSSDSDRELVEIDSNGIGTWNGFYRGNRVTFKDIMDGERKTGYLIGFPTVKCGLAKVKVHGQSIQLASPEGMEAAPDPQCHLKPELPEPESESRKRRERGFRSFDEKDYGEARPSDESEDPAKCDDPRAQRMVKFRTTCFLKVKVELFDLQPPTGYEWSKLKSLTEDQRKALKEGVREHLDADWHLVTPYQIEPYEWKDTGIKITVQPYVVPPHLWKSWEWGPLMNLLPILAVFQYGKNNCFWKPIMSDFDHLCGVPHVHADVFSRRVNALMERDACAMMLETCCDL